MALCNLTFVIGCDSRLYDPPATPFFKTAISGALSSGDIIQLEGQSDGTIKASYIDMHDNKITVSQLVSVNGRVFAWVQYDSTVPNPVPAPKGVYELSLTDYSLSRLPIDIQGSSPAQLTGLLSAGGRLFAATGDGLWELIEDKNGVWSLTSVLNEKLHMRTDEVYTDKSRICLRSADQRTCIVIDVEDFSRIEIPMDQNERIFGIAADAVYINKRGKKSFRAVALIINTVIENDTDHREVALSDTILKILHKTSWGVSRVQTLDTGRVLLRVREEYPRFRIWYIDPLAEESIVIEGFNSLDLVILE